MRRNRCKIIKKQYTIELWFKDKFRAYIHKQRKYRDYELLSEVYEDKTRDEYKFCRIYQKIFKDER